MKYWTILKLDCKKKEDDLADVVYRVYWQRWAKEIYGGVEYKTFLEGEYVCPQPGENFTEYNQLIPQQIEEWLNSGLDVSSIDAKLEQNLNDLIQPPLVSYDLPWQNK